TMDEPRGLGIALDEDLVELLLAELIGGLLAERVVADLAQAVPPPVEDRAECAVARAIADEPLAVAQLGVVGVDRDGGQLAQAVDDRGLPRRLAHGRPLARRPRDRESDARTIPCAAPTPSAPTRSPTTTSVTQCSRARTCSMFTASVPTQAPARASGRH